MPAIGTIDTVMRHPPVPRGNGVLTTYIPTIRTIDCHLHTDKMLRCSVHPIHPAPTG